MNFLINSLELLSNQKSFVLGVGCTRTNLWLLLHLKDLKIKEYKLCYQVNNGIRQRRTCVGNRGAEPDPIRGGLAGPA